MKRWRTLGLACGLVVLVSVFGPAGASATDGQPVIAGDLNTESIGTQFQMDCPVNSCVANGIGAVLGYHTGGSNDTDPVGVDGFAGSGSGTGIFPTGATGVAGTSVAGNGVFGTGSLNGVWGETKNAGASGVYGQNDSTGYGVAGRALGTSAGTGVLGDAPNATSGVGVEADSAHGTGLRVKGNDAFSRSGIATVVGTSTTPKNSVVVTVPGKALTATSIVLATIQGSIAGTAVQGVVKGTTSFTIVLTKNATTSVKIGWFIIN